MCFCHLRCLRSVHRQLACDVMAKLQNWCQLLSFHFSTTATLFSLVFLPRHGTSSKCPVQPEVMWSCGSCSSVGIGGSYWAAVYMLQWKCVISDFMKSLKFSVTSWNYHFSRGFHETTEIPSYFMKSRKCCKLISKLLINCFDTKVWSLKWHGTSENFEEHVVQAPLLFHSFPSRPLHPSMSLTLIQLVGAL